MYSDSVGFLLKPRDRDIYDANFKHSFQSMYPVADPGGPEGPGHPAPVKTSQKKMATAWGRKFRKSLGPPSTKFLDPLLVPSYTRKI